MPRQVSQTHIELPEPLERIVQSFIAEKRVPKRWHGVLRAAVRGLNRKATAAALGLSTHTVHAYRSKLCALAGVHRIAELVRVLLCHAVA